MIVNAFVVLSTSLGLNFCLHLQLKDDVRCVTLAPYVGARVTHHVTLAPTYGTRGTGQTVTFCTYTKAVFHLIHKFAYCLQFYYMKIMKHNYTLHCNYQTQQQSCIIQSFTGTQTSSNISYAI